MTLNRRLHSKWHNGQIVIYPGLDGPGANYFVDSTNGSDSNDGTTWEKAVATLAQAITLCSANNGDVIWLAPYHVETWSTAGERALNTAGVTIIGIRYGRQMPTITLTHITAHIRLQADNTSLHDVRFIGDVDQLIFAVDVWGDDTAIIGCEWRDNVGQA